MENTNDHQMSQDELSEIELATANFLMKEHGPVLDGAALVKLLHYPTLTALERSMQRGHLEVKTLNLPSRRGIFVHAFEMARYLTTQLAETHSEEQGDQPTDGDPPPRQRVG